MTRPAAAHKRVAPGRKSGRPQNPTTRQPAGPPWSMRAETLHESEPRKEEVARAEERQRRDLATAKAKAALEKPNGSA
jgi:hypothetical protein